MHGTLLRASATYCVGVAERSGTASPDPLLKGTFWVKVDYALTRTKIEKRTEREERNDFSNRIGRGMKTERSKKRIKGAAKFNEKRVARLM